VSLSDPILYPARHDTAEGLRQEALRTRTELANTVAALSERLSPRRAVRPGVVIPIVAGAVVLAALRRIPAVGALAGLGASAATAAALRWRERRWTAGAARSRRGSGFATGGGSDVVAVLRGQHRRIERGFAAVFAARGSDRLEAFSSLVNLLRHHERVEQEFVHPLLQSFAPDVADASLAEELAAGRGLASLISRGVDDPGFEPDLVRLRSMVADHAAHEESREFPVLRRQLASARLRDLGGQVRWSP
jgi:hypothetical protein